VSNKGRDDHALKRTIREEFEPCFEFVVRDRPKVLLPSTELVEAEVISLAEVIKTTEVEAGASNRRSAGA